MNSMVMAAQQFAIHVTLAVIGLGLALTTSGAAALIRTDFGAADAIRTGAGLASFALLASAGLIASETSGDKPAVPVESAL